MPDDFEELLTGYLERHPGITREEAENRVRRNQSVKQRHRASTTLMENTPRGGSWDDWLKERREGRQETTQEAPATPPAPFMVPWSERDQRIEWPRSNLGFVVDLPTFLDTIGRQLGGNIEFCTIDTWGHARPHFRMNFSAREIGLSFAPHGSKKVGVWAHLFDIPAHTVLGYVEVSVDVSLGRTIDRITRLLDEATPQIEKTRRDYAAEVAAKAAFVERRKKFAETYPEFRWSYELDRPFLAFFELPHSDSIVSSVDGQLSSNRVLIRNMWLNLTDSDFADLMKYLRKKNAFSSPKPDLTRFRRPKS